ncbi:MAG: hypothetical protein OS130_05895 [Thermodesulfobacteriota bacterium]|nr:MAG: hypothetical protein OS130_05895 [Thermodesulfobacteriota bacterium]
MFAICRYVPTWVSPGAGSLAIGRTRLLHAFIEIVRIDLLYRVE